MISFKSHEEKYTYKEINEDDVPSDIRFTTPMRFQGQVEVVAFGHSRSDEGDVGDPYVRIFDRSEPQKLEKYYKLVKTIALK
jgi:hypothetical protein